MKKPRMKKALLLNILLFFSFLTLAQGTLKGKVIDENGDGIPGVAIQEVGTALGVFTEEDGTYVLPLSSGKHIINFSYLGYGTITKTITIDNLDLELDIDMSSSATLLQEVVISTGSRNTQRTVTDAPLPIDIISARDLTSTGQNSFDKTLQYKVPSFNSVQTPVNDATSLLDPYEIRNMGPSRTLILINGKRKNLSSLIYIQTSPARGESGADISAIPTEAIKRVEILRDGASAQYGSDAIAGVMNIVLKDKYDYGSVNLNLGITGKGDGETFGISLNNGANIGEKGFINYTLSLSKVALANRPGKVDAAGESSDFGAPLSEVQSFLNRFPDAGNINGSPETSAAKFLVNGGFGLNKNTDFYYNAAYIYKKVNSYANYRTPYWRSKADSEGWQLYVNDKGEYLGYVPTFEGDLNDYHSTIGFKSKLGEWQTDVSFTTGGNMQFYTVANSRNRDLGISSPVLFKPGGYGFSHNVGNIDITRALRQNLNIGFGTEFRAEKYSIHESEDEASYVMRGADSFPGITPNNGGDFTRSNLGGYLDLGWDISNKFLLNGTIRLENYSDFGDAFVWKLSSRYKFMDNKAVIRGSLSTGFRAPSLHQINQQIAQASFVPGQGIQTKGIVNNRSSQAKVLGVPQLKAEKSNNFTLGVGLNPNDKFNVTLDYYNIGVKDRIVLGSEIAGTTAGNTALDRVLSQNGIVAVSFFVNALDTRTSGLDFVANYRGISFASGFLNASLAANLQLQNELDGPIKNPSLISQANRSVFDKTQEYLLFSSRPSSKAILGLEYLKGKFGLNLNNIVFGPTTFHQLGLPDELNTTFLTKVVTDLALSYEIAKKTTFTLNVNNLLNVIPEWKFIAAPGQESKAAATLKDAGTLKNASNAITFNQRYSIVTYDGSHFSQLGTILNASLNIKF